jgi:transcriptional regulator of acetoin/glycerol metabolism
VKSGVAAASNDLYAKNADAVFGKAMPAQAKSYDRKGALRPALCRGQGLVRRMGRILNTNRALIYRRIRAFGESLPELAVPLRAVYASK